MRDGAQAGNTDAHGFRLCQCDELPCRIDLHRGVHHQHGRVEYGQPDGCEILYRIVGELVAQCRIDRHCADGCEKQSTAVRFRFRHVFGRDCPVGACFIFDHGILSERDSHPIGEQPCHEIGGAAGGEADHQPDRPMERILGCCGLCPGRDKSGQREEVTEADHGAEDNRSRLWRHRTRASQSSVLLSHDMYRSGVSSSCSD